MRLLPRIPDWTVSLILHPLWWAVGATQIPDGHGISLGPISVLVYRYTPRKVAVS